MTFKKVKSCYIRLKVQHTLKLIWLVLSASKLVFWNKIKIEDLVFQFSNKNWKLKIEKKNSFFLFSILNRNWNAQKFPFNVCTQTAIRFSI